MDNELKEQFVHSIFRFRKIGTNFSSNAQMREIDVNMVELMIMKNIENNVADSNDNACSSDIGEELFMTKAAISQMVSSLEKKGYLERDVDKTNRRKLLITLTEKGHQLLHQVEGGVDEFLSKIISQMGETETKQFVQLINRFADISERLTNNTNQSERGI